MTAILNQKLSRRTLLRIGGCAGISVAACGIGGVIINSQTDLLDRLQGISDTPVLDDGETWAYEGGTLTLALDRIPDLAKPNGAIRLEDDVVPEPLLIVHGADDEFYVFVNRCPHQQRKIDAVEGKLECSCLSRSTFDYAGTVLSGPANTSLTTYTALRNGDRLVVTLA